MDKKKIEKLVSALTTQRVLLMAHQVLLQGIPRVPH